jgi:hypothetical protein
MVSASPQTAVDYEVIASTPDYYTLKVTLPEGASALTIMGSNVVPEFGAMSIIVLSLATIPLIYAKKRFDGLGNKRR